MSVGNANSPAGQINVLSVAFPFPDFVQMLSAVNLNAPLIAVNLRFERCGLSLTS